MIAEMMEDPLLTPKEVARLLRVEVVTLSGWRRSGKVKLPFQKIGGAIRYRKSDVQQFLDASRRAS